MRNTRRVSSTQKSAALINLLSNSRHHIW
jgi:hypothetical protein